MTLNTLILLTLGKCVEVVNGKGFMDPYMLTSLDIAYPKGGAGISFKQIGGALDFYLIGQSFSFFWEKKVGKQSLVTEKILTLLLFIWKIMMQ